MSNPTITPISPEKCLLGEGPFWEPRNNTVLFVDIIGQDIHRLNPMTGEYSKTHLGTTVGFAIPKTKSPDQMIIGGARHFQLLDSSNTSLKNIVQVDVKSPENRLNDGKCDAKGRLWAGTMGPEKAGQFEPECGALYSLDTDMTHKKQFDKVGISNGTTWSSDNKTMFYIDSLLKTVDAFDFDLQKGDISNRRTVVDFGGAKSSGLGFPDGMTIDANGKLWVACFNGGAVVRYDPETGKQLQLVKFPAQKITSCCFGGADFSDLFVTSASHGLSDDQSRSQPQAGQLFRVSGLGVKGLPAYTFGG